MATPPITALIDYEDRYVQPLIIQAIKSRLSENSYHLISEPSNLPANKAVQLQIRAYEAIDFEEGLAQPSSLFNAYIIRKALIRKHYLSNTIFSWVTKHPESPLRNHFQPAVDFELDYAEFLDDALVEAFELRAAFERNDGKEAEERQWWILKPSMSDRGQGIRLFSTEEELQSIFEQWEAQDPENDQDDDVEQEEDDTNAENQHPKQDDDTAESGNDDYIVTSHLRHFIAQPYIHPPLLIPTAPFNNRKFHIRTYVVAAGALTVYVYSHMLALFASESYVPPWDIGMHGNETDDDETLLRRMQNIHLTNTCVQTTNRILDSPDSTTDQENDPNNNNVYLLSTLPLTRSTHTSILSQIHTTTSALFSAALSQPTNFQPLPQSFEIFGFDFLVDGSTENVWLLEVNAFPDFAQTGKELRDKVVQGLWEEVVGVVVAGRFGLEDLGRDEQEGKGRLEMVFERDLGRG